MRCFVAVDLPKSVKEEIVAVQEELKGLPGRFSFEKDPHITLSFWGDADIDVVKRKLLSLRSSSFEAKLSPVGVFGNPPRVFWAGVSGKFEKLSKHFDSKNEFHSHITIARIKKILDHSLKEQLLKVQIVPLSFTVESVSLYSSVKARERYVHEKIATVKLSKNV